MTQTTLPSRSAIENEVVWCSFWPAPAGGGVHCSVGPSIGLPSRTRALQPLDIRIRQELGERGGGREIVGDALAGREADGTPDGVEMLDPIALQPGEIEAIQDAQRQQELKCLAGRRQRIDGQPAVARGQRLFPRRLDGLQVGEREAAAELCQMRNDRLAERATVEVARSLARQRLQRARQVRLANDLPERHGRRPAGVVLRPSRVERRLAPAAAGCSR